MQFAELRKKIPVMALAISSFGKIQGKLTKQDVQRAAAEVCDSRIVCVVRFSMQFSCRSLRFYSLHY